ncbi:hypothetical protein F5Y10DRAFT_273807 [Nemania abortiva]|nr:hypothetical protein F5Y10DRAFT_273807 [Nemania abortiva]
MLALLNSTFGNERIARRRDPELPQHHVDITSKAAESSRNKHSNSLASAPDKPGDGLHLAQMDATSQKPIATSSAIIGAPTPINPKAGNLGLEEAFENAYRWEKKCKERSLLSIRKNEIAQERAQRRLENEKFPAESLAYATDRDLEDRLKVADQESAVAALEANVEHMSLLIARQTMKQSVR